MIILMLETTGTTSAKKIMIFKSWNYLNACIFQKIFLNTTQKYLSSLSSNNTMLV